MRQALHIFLKDSRALRLEIAALVAFTAASGWFDFQPEWAGSSVLSSTIWFTRLPVLFAAWWFLVSRAVHQEVLPGTRQFWLTRPYSRRSLAGAKLLFCAVWINLPLLVMHCAILVVQGFSPFDHIAGLVWLQVAIAAAFIAPALALASVTSGLTQFAIAGLVAASCMLGMRVGDWIAGTAVVALLALAGSITLWRQYSARATAISRSILAAGFALAAAVLAALPWTATWAVQSRIPSAPPELRGVKLATDPVSAWQYFRYQKGVVVVEIPIQVDGVPLGVDMVADHAAAVLAAPGRADWRTTEAIIKQTDDQMWLALSIPGHQFDAIRSAPVELRASVALTLFSGRRSAAIPNDGRPVAIAPGTTCRMVHNLLLGQPFVSCRAALRAPDRILTPGGRSLDYRLYSPYPATFGLSPVSTFSAPFVTELITERAVAHLERSLQISGLRLDTLHPPTSTWTPNARKNDSVRTVR